MPLVYAQTAGGMHQLINTVTIERFVAAGVGLDTADAMQRPAVIMQAEQQACQLIIALEPAPGRLYVGGQIIPIGRQRAQSQGVALQQRFHGSNIPDIQWAYLPHGINLRRSAVW